MSTCCTQMYALAGSKAFYLGFSPAIARNNVWNGVAFCFFESTRSALG